jgi:hypothetical protein
LFAIRENTDFHCTGLAGNNFTPISTYTNPLSQAEKIKEVEIDFGDDFVSVLLKHSVSGFGPNKFRSHLLRIPYNLNSFVASGPYNGTLQYNSPDYFIGENQELIETDSLAESPFFLEFLSITQLPIGHIAHRLGKQ